MARCTHPSATLVTTLTQTRCFCSVLPLQADRPFLGICLGMQLLFDGSEESGGCEGLGIIPGQVTHFDTTLGLPVPHIGWNDLIPKWVLWWSCWCLVAEEQMFCLQPNICSSRG